MSSHLLLNANKIEHQDTHAFLNKIEQARHKKIALVVQGGGQRSIFTAGVFDAFLDAGFDPFELYIGTSAGALNLSSFISRQSLFSYNFIVNYTTEDEFFSLSKYLNKQTPLNLNWALEAISSKGPAPLNITAARESLQYRQAFACATRKDTLQDMYLPLYQKNWKKVLLASCAVPILYNKKVNINDMEWVDGGVSAAIPVKEAWKRGAELVIVIRTEPVEEENMVRVLYDWREKMESRIPQYIEKLSLNQPLDKVKAIHSGITQQLDSWKDNLSHKSSPIILPEIKELIKIDDANWKWLIAGNLERFLSLTGKGKSSEVIDMLTRYYQSYRELNDFLLHPPEGLMVLQIAPNKTLRSRILLSNKADLEIDYQEGKEVAYHFINHFADILNAKTTLKQP